MVSEWKQGKSRWRVKEPMEFLIMIALGVVFLSFLLSSFWADKLSASAVCSVSKAGTKTWQSDDGGGTSTRFVTVRCTPAFASEVVRELFATPDRFHPNGEWQSYRQDGKEIRFNAVANEVKLTNSDQFRCIAEWTEPKLSFLPLGNPYRPSIKDCRLVPRNRTLIRQ